MMKKLSLCILIALITLLVGLLPAAASFNLYYDPGEGFGDPSLVPEYFREGQTVAVDPSAGCYTVDTAVPELEGKIFLGWELDADEYAAVQVRYLEVGTDRELYPTYIESGLTPGEYYTAYAAIIEDYNIVGTDIQDILLKKGGPNWEDPWKNTIVFYYEEWIGPQ